MAVKSTLNVANYSSGYQYVNVCNNVNNYAGFGYECLSSSTYEMIMNGVKTVHNNETQYWITFYQNRSATTPTTWTSTALSHFNDTFEGITLTPPANMVSPIVLFPYIETDTASYNGYKAAIPDLSNPTWVSYNDWSDWGASVFNKNVIFKPLIEVEPDDPSGDTPTSDYSDISNAIYYLGAVIIVFCFFSIIYKMFIRLRG